MTELNLLPHRLYARERRKKYYKISFIIAIILFLLSYSYIKSHKKSDVLGASQKKTSSPKVVVLSHVKPPSGSIYTIKNPQDMTINIDTISVREALQLFLDTLHSNAVISPAIQGNLSLHLHHLSARKALEMLLVSQNLHESQVHSVRFIMTHDEWLRYRKDEVEWHAFMRESAALVTRVWQIHYANVGDIANLLQDNNTSLLSKRGHVRFDTRTNIICVQDIEESIIDINRLIKRLDIPAQKVLIEAYLATIDSDFEQTLGFQFSAHAPQDALSPHFNLAVLKLPDHSLLDVQLTALENSGHGELISKPSLLTANQKTASIEAGEEIPYQEIAPNGATSVAFKKAVLSLQVTPQVLPNDQILLSLHVNQDKPSPRLVLGVPSISTRQIRTEILVKNGQTIVLGGIYELNDQHNLQQVPFLGKIPYIGGLFQQHDQVNTKRELLIFVTPQIIR